MTNSEGVPHMSTDDDEYNGFYIPKGTILMTNVWLVQALVILLSILNFLFRSILHDRKVFNDPQEFKPERYLKDGKVNPDLKDPDCAVFGFGRRSVKIQLPTYTHSFKLILAPVYVLEDT